MAVELVGTGSASRIRVSDLPALIRRETPDASSDLAEANCLCLISQIDDQLIVWDLGGKCGTYVNGSRVTRATLKDSDTLGFGGAEFRVHAEPSPQRYLHGVRN